MDPGGPESCLGCGQAGWRPLGLLCEVGPWEGSRSSYQFGSCEDLEFMQRRSSGPFRSSVVASGLSQTPLPSHQRALSAVPTLGAVSFTEVPKPFPGPCAEQVTFPEAGAAGGGRPEAPSQEESEHLGLEGSECDAGQCSSNRSVLWPFLWRSCPPPWW